MELFLNGKSLGSKAKPADDSPRSWAVTFEKGSLKAVAKNKCKEVATDELITAGDPAKLMLTIDKSKISKNWDDIVYVTAKVVDVKGIVCPNVDKLISYKVSDNGTIVAVDNGDVQSHEEYNATERHSYHGQTIAIIKAKATSGKITVTTFSPELASGSVTIDINQ